MIAPRADASVEVPKLHNIKLLIVSFYTLLKFFIMINRIQNHRETQRVGNDRRWLLLKTIDTNTIGNKLAASQKSFAALFSLFLQIPIAS